MVVRRKRRFIAFGYHAGIVVFCFGLIKLGTAIGSSLMIKIAALLLAGDILTFRVNPLSRKLQELLIPEVACYACGTPIDLVGVYRCGCGFISHKERHAFSPCPMCGKYFSWVVCPVCETSIPV